LGKKGHHSDISKGTREKSSMGSKTITKESRLKLEEGIRKTRNVIDEEGLVINEGGTLTVVTLKRLVLGGRASRLGAACGSAVAVSVAFVSRRAAEVLSRAKRVVGDGANTSIIARAFFAVRAASALTVDHGAIISRLAASSAAAAAFTRSATRFSFATVITVFATSGRVAVAAGLAISASLAAIRAGWAALSRLVDAFRATVRAFIVPNPKEAADNADVIRRACVVHVAGAHGFQDHGVGVTEDVRRSLSNDETDEKETKQSNTEQHCVG